MKPQINRVEINITELCNRTCFFCPRGHGYENINLHMTPEVAEQAFIQTEPYSNFISMAGRGEPLLGKYLYEICELSVKYDKYMRIITNGDKLEKHITQLDNILDLKTEQEKMLVNCYDGSQQEQDWKIKYKDYSSIRFVSSRQTIDENEHKERNFYGLTNRGGSVPFDVDRFSSDHEPDVDSDMASLDVFKLPCYYLYFKTFINYNGDVNLCCHDWKVIRNFGNIMQKNFTDIWEHGLLNHYRQQLKFGQRQNFLECKNCDSTQEWETQLQYYNEFGGYYE
tara:strand:- start:1669 stop:2514 length:846 start_codon:yes stop_codon:yes gene_type:complete